MIGIHIRGSHHVIPLLRDEFEPTCGDVFPYVDVEVISEPLEPPATGIELVPIKGYVKKINAIHDGVFMIIGGIKGYREFYRLFVKWPKEIGQTVRLVVSSEIGPPASLIDDLRQRWESWDFLNDLEKFAYSLGNIIEFVVFLFNPAGTCLVHSSCVGWDGEVLIISGRSNVGKTTLNTLLMARYEGTYFSEDMTIIQKGTVWRNGRRYRIYPDLLRWNPDLAKQMPWLSILDRLHYRLRLRKFGNRGVRRLVSPALFWGEHRMGMYGRIVNAVLLKRHNHLNHSIEMVDIEPYEMVRQCLKNTAIDYQYLIDNFEIIVHQDMGRRWYEVKRAIGAWRARHQQLLFESLSRARCFEIRVGDSASPQDIAQFIMDRIVQN